MAAGVALPQALQLMSGVPLSKVGSVFMEKLSATKRLDGGQLQGLMRQVIQTGDLSSVMQNPMTALTSGIQGQLGGLAGQLSGVSGSAGLVAALTGSGGLGSAMTQLQASGDNLAGLTNGAAGFFAMIGHRSLAEMAGTALPSAASMATVTAPLASAPLLNTIAAQLPTMVSAVVGGTMAPDDAAAWVSAQVSTVASVVAGSAGALAWGQQMQTTISTVSCVAGAMAVPPTFDAAGNRQQGGATPFQGILSTIVRPSARAEMAASLERQIAHTRHDPVDTAAMTSLED